VQIGQFYPLSSYPLSPNLFEGYYALRGICYAWGLGDGQSAQYLITVSLQHFFESDILQDLFTVGCTAVSGILFVTSRGRSEVHVENEAKLVELLIGAFSGDVLMFVVGIEFECFPAGSRHRAYSAVVLQFWYWLW
jgi:hypothetical protein